MSSAVNGIEKFKEYFKNYTENYIIVGGTATNIFLGLASLNTRATKDIDMILICDKLNGEFGEVFWKFIEDGDYEAYKSKDNKTHYYRFINNSNDNYPKMIELFSKKQPLEELKESIFTPIIIDDEISSLSAIVLDDNYYQFLLDGKKIVEDLSVLDPIHLIAFKAKAHVDITRRKQKEEFVNERDSKKHKNDIFRLLQLLDNNSESDAPDIVKQDLNDFFSLIDENNTAVEALTNGALNYDEAIELLKKVFKL